jgi:predicted amidohydrolase
MKVKVSIIQFQPNLGDPKANIRTLRELFKKVSGSGLVVIPELANSGYNFKDREEAFPYSETIGEKGEYQAFLQEQATQLGIHIVSGINERVEDTLYNSAICVGPDGILGTYRKMHLFMNEKDIFRPGDAGLPVIDLGGYKIGMMICFDYLFPEPWRIMAQKGADIICHPSNLLTENAQRCIPGLSLMNRIYIANANRTGTERGLYFNGTSLICQPDGRIVEKASAEEDQVISHVIDTDLSRNKMVTARNHVFNDRRPDQYSE